jgi:hypothetical protein
MQNDDLDISLEEEPGMFHPTSFGLKDTFTRSSAFFYDIITYN